MWIDTHSDKKTEDSEKWSKELSFKMVHTKNLNIFLSKNSIGKRSSSSSYRIFVTHGLLSRTSIRFIKAY